MSQVGQRSRIALMLTWIAGMIMAGAGIVSAQEGDAEALTLRLRRNFGYSLGVQMQGTFTYRVSGPADLDRVEFLLDGQVIGEISEPPFNYGFNTRDYPEGSHRLSAVGYTAGGEQLTSPTITRQFVTTSTSTVIVVAVVGLLVVFRMTSYFLARRSGKGRTAPGVSTNSYLGGAVCPKCGRPFGIHWWSLRLGFSRYDRCPHCRRWSMVQRQSRETLESAAETMGSAVETIDNVADAQGEDEKMRRRIEDSRFDDG